MILLGKEPRMNQTELRARVRQELLAEQYRETGKLLFPVSVSNRHVHLDAAALSCLFGEGYSLTHQKDLVQLGQFACQETVTIRGPKGAIDKVRVLGPLRSKVQIEVSRTDCFKLGIPPTVRMSGDIAGSPSLTLEGPRGMLTVQEGAIVAMRHLHVPEDLADTFHLKNGSFVSLITRGERPTVLMRVAVRVSDKALLEAHVDTDEANAAGITNDMLLSAICEDDL